MWRKSSYSEGAATDCVEVALTPATAAVRDSKHIAPELRFPMAAWQRGLGVFKTHRG